MKKVFTLEGYKHKKMPIDPRYPHNNPNKHPPIVAVVITDEIETRETVQSAWSYALKYTAKGLDEPDYEAAAAAMIERHPAWVLASTEIAKVEYLGAAADKDKPES